eukprot:gnl/MRDRNA2_/MRDRNA2_15397_c0_seq1.p1 gnl/MRDRNA2_/MRDRNA2_15397_c0~~gnl/MRDRNA2_/MRDRNA2_15397_c0_seq1.p1  ORF type:complete len:693 (+),score=111.15 gnl/MRDRNA2_/MRDRNA2_15397_c0_seq1:222-2081(+)
MFEEGFIILMVMRELAAYSDKFRESVMASTASFEDDPSLHLSHHAYVLAKQQYEQDLKYNTAFLFFDHWINSIEVVVDGHVFDAHFRMPLICNFVLGRIKVEIMETITIDSPDDKAREYLTQCTEAYSQTLHTRTLSAWTPKLLHCGRRRHNLKPLNFFLKNDSRNLALTSELALYLAGLINLCLVFGLELRGVDGGGEPKFRNPDVEVAVLLFAITYLLMILTALVVTLSTYSPLDFGEIVDASKGNPPQRMVTAASILVCLSLAVTGLIWFQRKSMVFFSFVLLIHIGNNWKNGAKCPNNKTAALLATFASGLSRAEILRYTTFCALAIAGMSGMSFMYCFLLLDLLFLSQVLMDVTKAVTIPIKQLAVTGFLGIIILYEFSVMAFYFFRQDYNDRCEGMVDCLQTTIYLGLRMDLGSAIAPVTVLQDDDWYPRLGFDLTFWILVTTILMTVIIGIIIDTFGALRDKTQTREGYFKNTTFISCIDRSVIDKVSMQMGVSSGWDHLENEETGKQAVWKYMNFVFYLLHKDPNRLTGAETKIKALMQDGDVSWLPLGTCKLMQSAAHAAQVAAHADQGSTDKRLDVLAERVEEVLGRLSAIEQSIDSKDANVQKKFSMQ